MRRCPECRRDYYDDSLLYCLDDGAHLLDGPASGNEHPTAVIPADGLAARLSAAPSIASISEKSIAVLPFAHLSSDPDDEYFGDGLAEELMIAMTRIEGLKVAARTSSFLFKTKPASVSEIGRELGVATILEGSVRKSGSQLRVTVQLIKTADGYQLWSERFDREMRDVFEIQDEITLAVVEALKIQLGSDRRDAVLKKGTDNSEAYQLYLRGRALWNSRTKGSFQKAIENFEKAIEIDPQYALAFAALADCYSFLAYFGAAPVEDVAPKARAAVNKAIALDPHSAECWTAKAASDLMFEFDFGAAERGYQTAISIEPQNVTPHYLYCAVLTALARFDDAIEEGRRAVEIDPLSPHANAQLARALCCTGRPEEAISLVSKVLEVMPDFHHLQWILGWAYGQTGNWDVAIDHYRNAADTGGPILYGFLGHALVRGGRREEALLLLEKIRERSQTEYISPIPAAVIEGALGNISKGLDLLEFAWEKCVVHLMWIAVDPVFDVFRDEPRFKHLAKALNLPA